MLVTSPDITALDFDVLMDISGAAPSMQLTNRSVELNPTLLKWAFEIYSPGGIPIHKGNMLAPDRTLWSTPFVKTTGFPRPFNQIEWSGNPYTVIVRCQDTTGNVFALTKPVKVCRPLGNKPSDKNTYGAAQIKITTRCRDAKLFAEDTTSYQYQGAVGTKVTSIFELRYPPDGTGTSRLPFVAKQFNTALIPVSQSGRGYQYYFTSVVDFIVADGVTVRCKFVDTQNFPVYCNIDLSPIAYNLNKLIDDAENGRCDDREDARSKIALISSKLQLATMAILWPQNEVLDTAKLLDEINELAGWQCDCLTSGVEPLSTIGTDTDGRTYEVVSDGGDISGNIEEIVGGIRIHLKDFTYKFGLCQTSTSAAYALEESVSGNIKNICLKVDKQVFAEEVVNQFETNTTLKNRLSQAIVTNVSAGNVNVSGRCVLPASRTYTYTFTSPVVATGKTLLFTQLVYGGVTKPITFLFDRSNPGALQTALNNLGVGSFTVTFVGNVVTVAITGITQEISSFTARLSDQLSAQELSVQRSITDNSSYTVGTVLQALIDYVCTMVLSKITAGQGFSVKELQLVTGAVATREIKSEQDLASVLGIVIAAQNNIVDYVTGLKGVNCDSLRAAFPAVSAGVGDTTLFYGTDGQKCQSYDATAIARKVLQLAATDPNVKGDFCTAQAACGKATCTPVTNASLVYDADARTLTLTITNTGALRYRVGIRYKTNPLGAWLNVQEVAAQTGVTTTQTFGNVPAGQWVSQVIAICASGEATPYIATSQACPTPTTLSANVSGSKINVTVGGLIATAEKWRLEISLPNGGKIATNYPITSTSIAVDVPAGVYGNYSLVAMAVCDESAAWYSPATSPVVVGVAAPATYPTVDGIEVRNITATTATVLVTKKAGTSPTSVTLSYSMYGGATQQVTGNDAGDVVTFNLTSLTGAKIYNLSARANYTGGVSDAYNGGNFVTQPALSATSSITNNGTTNASSVTLKVGGVVIAGTGTLNATDAITFAVNNYQNAVVVLKVCDASAVDAQIISGGVTYNPTSTNGSEFMFYGVNITNPMNVIFSNTVIP